MADAKVIIIPYIGTGNVAPNEKFEVRFKDRTKKMESLLKKFPGVESFEIENQSEEFLMEYRVQGSEIKLYRNANERGAASEDEKKPVEATVAKDTKNDDFDQGPESNRRIQDDSEIPAGTAVATSTVEHDRGAVSRVIEKTLESGIVGRPEILKALREAFPDKTDKTLKNTMGALVHLLLDRNAKNGRWTVEKIQDPKDSRRVSYKVTVNDPPLKVEDQKKQEPASNTTEPTPTPAEAATGTVQSLEALANAVTIEEVADEGDEKAA